MKSARHGEFYTATHPDRATEPETLPSDGEEEASRPALPVVAAPTTGQADFHRAPFRLFRPDIELQPSTGLAAWPLHSLFADRVLLVLRFHHLDLSSDRAFEPLSARIIGFSSTATGREGCMTR